MEEKSHIEAELETVEQLIADATSRAAELEKALGLVRSMNSNDAAADAALIATYGALGVLTRRRATLLRIIGSYKA